MSKLQRLPPDVNKILFVRNLPFKVDADQLYSLFGKYGAIRQIRLGIASDTKGTAFVVYDDIYDAKIALESLNGLNFMGRYLIILYFQASKLTKKLNLKKQEEELASIRAKYG